MFGFVSLCIAYPVESYNITVFLIGFILPNIKGDTEEA